MKRLICMALLVLIAFGISGATQKEEAEEEQLKVAKVYPAPMVVPEIKHYAPEPAEEAEQEQIKEEPKQKQAEQEQIKEEPEQKQAAQSSGALTATITHYCACSSCNGKYSYQQDGINYTATASGVTLYDGIDGNYCAATFGKLGDVVSINGVEYKIVDRMGSNSGTKVDVFVSAGHAECNRLGRYTAEVELTG